MIKIFDWHQYIQLIFALNVLLRIDSESVLINLIWDYRFIQWTSRFWDNFSHFILEVLDI